MAADGLRSFSVCHSFSIRLGGVWLPVALVPADLVEPCSQAFSSLNETLRTGSKSALLVEKHAGLQREQSTLQLHGFSGERGRDFL